MITPPATYWAGGVFLHSRRECKVTQLIDRS